MICTLRILLHRSAPSLIFPFPNSSLQMDMKIAKKSIALTICYITPLISKGSTGTPFWYQFLEQMGSETSNLVAVITGSLASERQ